MKDRYTLYVGALLHDIGKFIERAKDASWQDKAYAYIKTKESSPNYAHRRYSAAFIRQLAEKKEFIPMGSELLALWHHRGNESDKKDCKPIHEHGMLTFLLRLSDDFASSERRKDTTLAPQPYQRARLLSPFADIHGHNAKNYFDIGELSVDKHCMPLAIEPSYPEGHNSYSRAVQQFLEEIEQIASTEALLSLMEKWLHSVPAQTPVEINGQEVLYRPDINLYDHSRLVAAIAICLYDEWTHGSWKGKDADIVARRDDLPDPCILIGGDVSGIQDFIFSIPSKKAAWSLKGRSMYVQWVTEICARYVIQQLKLETANILYVGGGNFQILAPHNAMTAIPELQRQISNAFLETGLYIAIGSSSVSIADFQNFSTTSQRLNNDQKSKKQRRCYELGHAIFEPFLPVHGGDAYVEITRRLTESRGYSIEPVNDVLTWQQPFNRLGLGIKIPSETGYAFNHTDIGSVLQGFRFYVKDLPKSRKEGRIEQIADFDELAENAYQRTGTEKLGVLKMDVDNLGKLFAQGIPESDRTISRVAALSRSLKWFFEGYINSLLDSEEYKNQLYVVFSGGDDCMMVGSWDKVFDFALAIRNEFRMFVGNPNITISASLLVVDPTFPVVRFAALAEERLHEAKHMRPQKNCVSVYDSVLSWEDFDRANDLQNKLSTLVVECQEPRAVISKIVKSTSGFTRLRDDAKRGKVKPEKVWRLAYYLRDVGKHRNQTNEEKAKAKAIIEDVITLYETMVFDLLRGKDVNPALICVAARWAEMKTRQKYSDKEI